MASPEPTPRSRTVRSTYGLYGEAVASRFAFESHIFEVPEGRTPTLTFEPSPTRLVGAGDREVLYESAARDAGGHSRFTFERAPGTDVLTFANAAAFAVAPSHVTYNLVDPSWAHGVEIWFLGTVMAYWLERAGLPALHASAVVAPEGAAAFLGSGGTGKSSLALAFLKGGHALLTEDVLAVEHRGGQWWGRPSYPQARVWADQAAYVGADYKRLPRVQPHREKRRLPIGPGGLGRFHSEPAPLRALYVPERGEAGGAVVVEPMTAVEAFGELVRHSFLARLLQAVGLQSERLERLGALARTLPVRRLQVPAGLEHLDAVREAVREDLQR
jgi:hypothetical protein